MLSNRNLSKIEEQSKILQNIVHKLNEITLLLKNEGKEVMGTTAMPEGLSLALTNEQEIGKLEEKLMEKGLNIMPAVHKIFAATSEVEVDRIARNSIGNARDMDRGGIRRAMSSYGIPPIMI